MDKKCVAEVSIRGAVSASGYRVMGCELQIPHYRTFSLTGTTRRSKGLGLAFFVLAVCLTALSGSAQASFPSSSIRSVDFELLASAIYKAEGGAKTNHPYGILRPYCSKSSVSQCRKGCLQTIEKRYRMWLDTNPTSRDAQSFIQYLSRSYAPLNAKNDPSGLNKNWIKNVTHFYGRLYADTVRNKDVGHG